jgi:DNA modification methylase
MKLIFETWPIERCIEYARNPRKNDHAVDKVAAAIREFGFRVPICAKSDGTVVDGHLRLKAAKKLGLKEVPVILADDMSEAQIKAFRLSVNKVAELAEWDKELLALEFGELEDMGFDLSLTGFEADEIGAMFLEEAKEGLTDDDAVPEVPAVPVTVEGDVWVLGRHRLMCGDSTSIDAVERLMDGRKPDLIHTDPPYGIGYGGSMKLGQAKHGWKQHSGGWDENRPPKEFFDLAEAQCADRIIWGGNYFSDFLPPTMGWLVWDKGQRGFSLADGEMAWTSFNNAMRIKDYARAKANREEKHHATQKPIELIEWALEYADRHAKNKPVAVLDFFGGSGSTLIACEKTARDCRMMELDPKYCDVIVKRWQDWTGQQATLEATGQTFAELSAEREAA